MKAIVQMSSWIMGSLRPVICLAALWGVSPGALGQTPSPLPSASPFQVGLSAAGLERVGSTVQGFIDEGELAGAVAIVARRGRVVHFEARGMQDIERGLPMRKETIFRIYSMTKAVVSVAVMMLHEAGRLDLDVPASRYLPVLGRMRLEGGAVPTREMTVRDLLRHTAGFPNNVTVDRHFREAGLPPLSALTLEEMMDRLDHVPLRYSPGTDWYYSFATDVLARLVEIASGRSVDQFLHEQVFQPLRMVDTGFHIPESKRDRFAVVYGNGLKEVEAPQPGTSGRFTFETPPKFLSGGGGLVSTASDYMRFCLMLWGRGRALDGTRLLKMETVEEMTRNQLAEGLLISRPPAGRGFGLGFAVRTEEIATEPSSVGEYEWLGGAGTEFWVSPRDELVVITLSQQMPMRSLGSALKPLIYDAILEERHLLLDSRVVASTKEARLKLGTVDKAAQNPLFVEDKPWEPRFDNLYPTVIYDREADLYRCWYNGFLVDERTSATPPEARNPRERPDYMGLKPNRREEGVCYAVSNDGLRWEKPELGLVTYQGSAENNIVLRGPSGMGILWDARDPDPMRRYKMFYSGHDNNVQRVVFSPDGLRWSEPLLCPEIEAGGDTHNNAVWDPVLGRYVGIMRLWEGQRIVGRTETPDFVHWTKSVEVLRGSLTKQTHDMVIVPTSGIYVGLLGVMHYPEEGSNHGVTQSVELAWSPDSRKWHWLAEGLPFIDRTLVPNRTPEYGSMPYDWGAIFPATPLILEDEIRIYYGASDWYFFDWRRGALALARLRPDGWAGYEPIEGTERAWVTTSALASPRGALAVTADVQKGGSVRVRVLDDGGEVVAVSEPVETTVSDGPVVWQSGEREPETLLKARQGDLFRLRFELDRAKLYSFRFEPIEF